MVLKLDEKVGLMRMDQFASQIEHISPEVMRFLKQSFSGGHSKEFYEGLLAGYANTHVLATNLSVKNFKKYSGPIVAFVADHVKNIK